MDYSNIYIALCLTEDYENLNDNKKRQENLWACCSSIDWILS